MINLNAIARKLLLWQILTIFSFLFLFPNSDAKASESIFRAKIRKHISMVGSSTVYPFAATIAETFGRDFETKTPIVEATGTGGGFKLFCSGIGYEFPDFVNASRKIEKSELKKCDENKISPIEIKIGYDGIVLANSIAGQKFSLTKRQIFLALAAKLPNANGDLEDNYYQKWSDINPKLPAVRIAVYGPPSTSGTRDSFVELVLESVCRQEKSFIKAFSDEKIRNKKCRMIRSDGKFIEAGENDNLIVQKLSSNQDALGIFGFGFLEENQNKIMAARIDDIEPSFENIAKGNYQISRPLFIYFKAQHLNLVPKMRDFIGEIVNENTIGNDGYLLQKGLVPLSNQEVNQVKSSIASFAQ